VSLAPSGFNFEENLQHDRHAEWKARNPKNHADRQLVFSKDIAQQLRRSVSHLRLRVEVSFGCDVRNQSDDPGHFIERAQVVSRGGEYVQSRDTRGFASLFDVVLSAQPAHELRFMPDDRQNATEIKQVARLNTFQRRRRSEWAGGAAQCRAPQAGVPRSPASGSLGSPFA
jgi:hypothetical protein